MPELSRMPPPPFGPADPDFLPVLTALLADPHPKVRYVAVNNVQRLGEAGRPRASGVDTVGRRPHRGPGRDHDCRGRRLPDLRAGTRLGAAGHQACGARRVVGRHGGRRRAGRVGNIPYARLRVGAGHERLPLRGRRGRRRQDGVVRRTHGRGGPVRRGEGVSIVAYLAETDTTPIVVLAWVVGAVGVFGGLWVAVSGRTRLLLSCLPRPVRPAPRTRRPRRSPPRWRGRPCQAPC